MKIFLKCTHPQTVWDTDECVSVRALTLPSCPVFMQARGFGCARAVRSLVCVICFVLERGVRIPALMSWVSVSCRGSDTCASCSVSFRMNESRMHLYSTLCIFVHPKHFTIMWGVSPQPPPVCSIHLDDVTAATGQRCQCAHHTPATGGEERES